jgi:predicted ATP-dependent endonuclease of OLD family
MKVKKIRIQNYKSIRDCEIPIKNNLLCFVGKNESGKSNVLESFKFIDFNNQFSKKDVNKIAAQEENKKFPVIYLKFEISPAESKKIVTFFQSLDYVDKELLKHGADKYETLELLRWGNGVNTFKIVLYNKSRRTTLFDILSNTKKASTLLKAFFDNVIPHIEFFDNEELSLEAASVSDLKGKSKKFNTFRKLLYIAGCNNYDLLDINIEDRESIANRLATYQKKATDVFKNYYFQDQSIEFSFIYVGDKISLSINDETGSYFAISERSPGFRYFFAFLVNKISITQQRDKASIFLLDEPANNLHPKGARDFINLISKIGNSQIIFNTHNPFLISREDLDSLILLKKDKIRGTVTDLKPYRSNYQVLRRELGMLLNDSFLIGESNITVEGATEKYCLNLVFNDLCKNSEIPLSLEWVNIFDCGGVTETKVSLNYLGKSLNLSGIILLDSDKEADDMLKHNKNSLIHDLVKTSKWSIIRLNDVFPDSKVSRTFEDMFPQDLYIEKYNEYCQDLNIFDKEFEQYKYSKKIKSPIIDELKVHFQSFFNDSKKKKSSINKVHITRLIFDSIPQNEWSTKFKSIYKLANKINTQLKFINNG